MNSNTKIKTNFLKRKKNLSLNKSTQRKNSSKKTKPISRNNSSKSKCPISKKRTERKPKEIKESSLSKKFKKSKKKSEKNISLEESGSFNSDIEEEKEKVGLNEKNLSVPPLKNKKKKYLNASEDFNGTKMDNSIKIKKKINLSELKIDKYPEDPSISIVNHDIIEDCCILCNEKNLIRAINTNDKILFTKCLKSIDKISSLNHKIKIIGGLTPLQYIIKKRNKVLLTEFLYYLKKNKNEERISIPEDKLYFMDSGKRNFYNFGFHTKPVELSRGNKIGNNAFVNKNINIDFSTSKYDAIENNDDDDYGNGKSDINLYTIQNDEDFLYFNNFIKNLEINDDNDYDLNNFIYENIEKGNISIAEYFMSIFTDKETFRYNTLHQMALSQKPNAEKQLDIKNKMSINKKSSQSLTPVHLACINPNYKILEELIKNGGEIEFLDNKGRKPIHYAALCKRPGTLKVLIDNNCNVNDREKNGFTPLIHACRAGRYENVKILLENQADPLARPGGGQCMGIHYACLKDTEDNLKIIKLLLEKNPELIDINGKDRKTPLHFAVLYNCYKIVEFLVKSGANLNKGDKYGRTPLLLSCKYGNSKITKFLIDAGANINKSDNSNNSPLHYACAFGNLECVKVLLESGADINYLNMNKNLPIEIALLKNHNGIIKYLINYDKFNVDTKFGNGNYILLYYLLEIDETTFDSIKYIIEDKKGDANVSNSNNMNAFHFLSHFTYRAYLSLFTSKKEKEKLTEDLHKNKYHPEYLKILAKYIDFFKNKGCEPDQQNTIGQTPLMLALKNGNFEFGKILIEAFKKKINIKHIDSNGFNIFDYAFSKGKSLTDECIQFIKSMFDIYKNIIDKAFLNTYTRYGRNAILNLCEDFGLHIYEKLFYITKINSLENINNKFEYIKKNEEKIRQKSYDEFHDFIINKFYSLIEEFIKRGADINCCTSEKKFVSKNKKFKEYKYYNNVGKIYPIMYLMAYPCSNELIKLIKKYKIDINCIDLSKKNSILYLYEMEFQIKNISADNYKIIFNYLIDNCSKENLASKSNYSIFFLEIDNLENGEALKIYNKLGKNYIDLNDKNEKFTLLGEAIYHKNDKKVNYLLDNFKDINLKIVNNLTKRNALHYTCICSNSRDEIDLNKFNRLINLDPSLLSQKDIFLRNPLFYLFLEDDLKIKKGDPISILSYLLEIYYEKFKKKFDINSKDYLGQSLIFYALKADASFCVSCLINLGAELNFKDKFNNSIFTYAIQLNSSSLPELFLKSKDIKIFEDKLYEGEILDKTWKEIELEMKNKLVENGEKEKRDDKKEKEIKYCIEELFKEDDDDKSEESEEKEDDGNFPVENDNNLETLFEENDEGTNTGFSKFNLDNDTDYLKEYYDLWNISKNNDDSSESHSHSQEEENYDDEEEMDDENEEDNDDNEEMDDENEEDNDDEEMDDNGDDDDDNETIDIFKDDNNNDDLEEEEDEESRRNGDDESSENNSNENEESSEDKSKKNKYINMSPDNLEEVNKNIYVFNYCNSINISINKNIRSDYGTINYQYRNNYLPPNKEEKKDNYPEINTIKYNLSLEKEKNKEEKEESSLDSLFKYCIKHNKQNLIYYILNQGYSEYQALEDTLSSGKFKFALLLINRFDITDKKFRSKNKKGQTLLHILCNNKKSKKNEENIEEIYEIFTKKIKLDINEFDNEKHTPLYYAVLKGNTQMIKLITENMKENKYNLFLSKDKKSGISPLNLLYDKINVKKNSNNIILLKIIYMVTKKTKIGYFKNIAKYLVKNYSENSLKSDKKDEICLILKIFQNLIKNCKIDINSPIDNDGNDIFILSAKENNYFLFNDLLLNEKNSKSIQNTNRDGKTLIHMLVSPNPVYSFQNKKFLEKAINKGFKQDIKDKNNLTPLDYAIKYNFKSMIDILNKSNSKATNKNKSKKDKMDFDIDDIDDIDEKDDKYCFKNINYDYHSISNKYYKEIILPCIKKNYVSDDESKAYIAKNCGLKLSNYHIYKDDKNCLYNVNLGKVDIKRYKYGEFVFYHLQLLVNDKKKMYHIITRWGRFGDRGEYQNTPFNDLEDAIKEFNKIFLAKTGNKWEEIKSDLNYFDKKEKKYALVKLTQKKPEIYDIINYFKTKIKNIYIFLNKKNFDLSEKIMHPNVKKFFITLIKESFKYIITKKYNSSDNDSDDESENEIDALYLPKETIEKGFKILSEIGNVNLKIEELQNLREKMKLDEKSLQNPNSAFNKNINEYRENSQKLIHLTNSFYETIPFKTPRHYTIAPLNKASDIETEIKQLLSLSYIEETLQLFLSSLYYNKLIDPIAYMYKAINKKIVPLNLDLSSNDNKDKNLVELILNYINLSKNDKKNKITNIFEIFDKNEKKWDDSTSDKRMLLFHGTKSQNMLGILSKGLLIAPIESEITGNSYGNGIYLSDSFSKSINYCKGKNNYILLVDILLDKIYKTNKNKFTNVKDLKKKGFNCLINNSLYYANLNDRIYLNNGTSIPTNYIKNSEWDDYDAEYVIYDPKNVNIKYIIEITKED